MGVTNVLILSPAAIAIVGRSTGKDALKAAQERFSGSSLHNGSGDAWRHFRWNFDMAQRMGRANAAAAANLYESTNPNPVAEHSMDYFNNSVGRQAADDSRYSGLTPNQAADRALRNGCLQTSD